MTNELLKNMPSEVREKAVEHFTKLMEKSDEDSESAAFAYALDKDEKKRSEALIAFGEYRAYVKILEFFKL